MSADIGIYLREVIAGVILGGIVDALESEGHVAVPDTETLGSDSGEPTLGVERGVAAGRAVVGSFEGNVGGAKLPSRGDPAVDKGSIVLVADPIFGLFHRGDASKLPTGGRGGWGRSRSGGEAG
jgi:hypothetical protein